MQIGNFDVDKEISEARRRLHESIFGTDAICEGDYVTVKEWSEDRYGLLTESVLLVQSIDMNLVHVTEKNNYFDKNIILNTNNIVLRRLKKSFADSFLSKRHCKS